MYVPSDMEAAEPLDGIEMPARLSLAMPSCSCIKKERLYLHSQIYILFYNKQPMGYKILHHQ